MNKKNTYKTVFGFVILTVILALLVYLNLIYGSTGKMTDFTEPTSLTIIKQIRLPRLLSAMILGGALSVSGFLLQTFFANPIAGPYILGISSGAKLTVALTMVFALQKGIFLELGVRG